MMSKAFIRGCMSIFIACILVANSVADGINSRQAAAAIQTRVIAVVDNCIFRYIDYYKGFGAGRPGSYYGNLPLPIGEISIGFSCYEAPDWPAFASQAGAKLDPASGHWVMDKKTIAKWNGPDSTLQELSDYERSFRYYDLQAINSSGFYVVNHDIIGDPDKRIRHFHAYIPYKGHVLAVDAQDINAPLNTSKKSIVPLVVRLLKTVEFMDDLPAPVAASSPTR